MLLDAAEPVVGSFTADGLTYAVDPDGLTLVAIDASAVVEDGSLTIPKTVAYGGATHSVIAIAPYAFYLSGATQVELPATITSVDDRAFRSSDVERVEVDPANESFASYDGVLYSAGTLRLLLIPGGRQGAVRISSTAEEVDARAFSHCAGVDAISADAGSAHFASWDGLLYTADGATLLRVPAGAAEITIRDGCTAIAAGALEGCAKLERINAPASVVSISPNVFDSVPTIALPAQTALRDEENSGVASGLPGQSNASTDFVPQLTAMVALISSDDNFLGINPSSIAVMLDPEASEMLWKSLGVTVFRGEASEIADLEERSTYSALRGSVTFHVPDGYRISGTFHTGSNGSNTTVNTASGGSVTAYYSASRTSEWIVDLYGAAYSLYLGTYYFGAPPSWSGGNVVDIASGKVCTDGSWFTDAARTTPAERGYHASDTAPLHVYWFPNSLITCVWDSQGGSNVANTIGITSSSAKVPMPTSDPTRPGYSFAGWWTDITSGVRVTSSTPLPAKDVTYYAHWEPVLSAEVPLDATIEMDVLGLEEPKEAPGYIKSLCGEPLKVAEVAFVPLAGAADLFGSSAADVALEVQADGSALPNVRFPLDADATETNASKLAAFLMGSYGERIPVSYRLLMPSDVQTALAEFADPKPICQISYTVALA